MSTPSSTAAAAYARLIDALDLPAKVRLLTGASGFTLAEQDSIGLNEVRLSDGPTGVRGPKFVGGRTVTLFPNATLLASAWSEDTAYEVGRLLAEEALVQRIHLVLGPTINLHRSPLGGRLFEAYSEDPLLTGKLAAAYVRGLQDQGIGACLKHLIANESETDRTTMNSVVDEATLRELYLLPFEIAVQESDPWSIMDAYNNINGVPATEQDHVNNGIVKGEWGYTGLIMSDWHATKSAGPAANGGLDLVMPGPVGPWGDALIDAVRSGEVDESVIDDHVQRVLLLADRVGALGGIRDYPEGIPTPDSTERKRQLTRLAAAGMTVLSNNGPVLPLAPTQTVALIGRHALETIDMGGGSAQVNPPYQVSVAEGLTARLGDAVTIADGVEVRTRPVPARPGFVTDPETGSPGVHFTLLAADGSVIEERHSRSSTTAIGMDDDFDAIVHTIRFRARVNGHGPMEIGAMGAGSWTLRAGGQTFEIQLRLAGLGPSEEVLMPPVATRQIDLPNAGVVEGAVVVQPPEAREATDEDPVAATAPASSGLFRGLFGLLARPAPRATEDAIADAVVTAAAADVAVVVVGLTEEQEAESVDKSTLHLPGEQDALVTAVAAAARKTVVVVNSATPILMPWLGLVDAVLWAGLPGQEGGHAVAAALLGDIEPAGRLVTTFPVADGASPAWSVSPIDGDLPYGEGTFIGYRGHYAGLASAPEFWMGHGLGYSTWEYRNARLTDSDVELTVSVDITNTGSRSSREVVQVYLQPDLADEPVRLVGWASAVAVPGETRTVRVQPDQRLWRRWDAAADAWGHPVESGQLLVARGLGDIRATIMHSTMNSTHTLP